MTVFAIIICVIITVFALFTGFAGGYTVDDIKGCIIGGLIAIIISGIMWAGVAWWFANTESGKRALKTQDSNFNGGITRQVLVYDMDGDLIAEYKGKFDIEHTDGRIMFDDENGQRHIIYFKSGSVIVNELSGGEKV